MSVAALKTAFPGASPPRRGRHVPPPSGTQAPWRRVFTSYAFHPVSSTLADKRATGPGYGGLASLVPTGDRLFASGFEEPSGGCYPT